MLEKFIEIKKREVSALRNKKDGQGLGEPWQGKRPDFSAALASPAAPGQVNVIAEYKRASPSMGDICPQLEVEDVARQYRKAGAAALSILTEEVFFKGNFDFLARAAKSAGHEIPLLRKDFIIDPIQIEATAASPASAVLLIVRLSPDAKILRDMRELAESYGIQCVVEAFDAADIRVARESGARIIQVNARDLDTLQVDRKACLKLIEEAIPQRDEIWIQASGVSKPEHLFEAAEAGYQAALIGTSLMRGGEPGLALANLLAPSGNKGAVSHDD